MEREKSPKNSKPKKPSEGYPEMKVIPWRGG